MQATDWDFGAVHAPTAYEQGTLHERVKAGPEFTELRRRLRRRVFPLTAAYVRFAQRRLDPLAAQIRGDLEGGR